MKQTNKKRTNKQTDKQRNKQKTYKQIDKQTNKQLKTKRTEEQKIAKQSKREYIRFCFKPLPSPPLTVLSTVMFSDLTKIIDHDIK